MHRGYVVLATLVLSACATKKAALDSELTEALDRELAVQGACFELEGMPVVLRPSEGASAKGYDRLVELGFLSAQKEQRKIDSWIWSRRGELEDVRVYYPTAKGAARMSRAQSFTSKGKTLLCADESPKVEEIARYTTPAPSNGVMISHVSFRRRAQVPAWAEALNALGQFAQQPSGWASGKPVADMNRLVSTSAGWATAAELDRNGAKLARSPVEVPAVPPRADPTGVEPTQETAVKAPPAAVADPVAPDTLAPAEVPAPTAAKAARVRPPASRRSREINTRVELDDSTAVSAPVQNVRAEHWTTPTGRVVIAAPPP